MMPDWLAIFAKHSFSRANAGAVDSYVQTAKFIHSRLYRVLYRLFVGDISLYETGRIAKFRGERRSGLAIHVCYEYFRTRLYEQTRTGRTQAGCAARNKNAFVRYVHMLYLFLSSMKYGDTCSVSCPRQRCASFTG